MTTDDNPVARLDGRSAPPALPIPPALPAESPRAIRSRVFGTTRRKGLDPSEVATYLGSLADQVEAADADRAGLRAELDQYRERVADEAQRAEITADAVGLLSQAQQIADNLVAEAEQYSRDLVESARRQQREVLEEAQESVRSAASRLPSAGEQTDPQAGAQTAELEYIQTFTHVAHVQLRSILDALGEQVERLGRLPRTPPRGLPHQDGETPGQVQWWIDLSDDGRQSADGILSPGGARLPG